MYTYLIGMPERIRKRDKILLNRIFTLFSRLHSEYDFRSLPMERPAPFSNHSLPAASTKSACGSLFKTHQCFNRERATLTGTVYLVWIYHLGAVTLIEEYTIQGCPFHFYRGVPLIIKYTHRVALFLRSP